MDKTKIIAAQIDKVCDMALDPEACQAYQIKALQIIQNINKGHWETDDDTRRIPTSTD